MFEDLKNELGSWVEDIRGPLLTNEAMSKYTWFQVGGPAQLLFQPADADDLSYFLANLSQGIPVLPIGVGSNLLVRDGGVPGVVIRLSGRGFAGLSIENETDIRAGAASPDKAVAAFALKNSLDGFSFYHGIPGRIGGALRMNAGANGMETTDILQEVVAYDRMGVRHVLSHEDMGYSYRSSSASTDLIFTEARFRGVRGDTASIQEKMDAVQKHRVEVQPVKEKTGGSTFKNPDSGSAWREIDAAGCRGLMIGDAQISEMHCNFMINTHNASASDLERLGETARARVLEHSGTKLDWEIKRIGLFHQGDTIEAFTDYGS